MHSAMRSTCYSIGSRVVRVSFVMLINALNWHGACIYTHIYNDNDNIEARYTYNCALRIICMVDRPPCALCAVRRRKRHVVTILVNNLIIIHCIVRHAADERCRRQDRGHCLRSNGQDNDWVTRARRRMLKYAYDLFTITEPGCCV